MTTFGNVLYVFAFNLPIPPIKETSVFFSTRNPVVYVGLHEKIRAKFVPKILRTALSVGLFKIKLLENFLNVLMFLCI